MQTINPLIPMGAITGKPTREDIVKILTRYREAGLEQYLIYPRSGCELEYMSEEYLLTVEMICEEAERLGFKAIWLYDEFNWPSGTCWERVPRENPEFSAQFLCAYHVDGKVKVEIKQNPIYSDLMNPAAVKRFIELTHERYFERLGKWFGSLIKGIFTDEPDIGYYYNPGKEIPVFSMGYYTGLEEDYRALTGGDLMEDIAAGVRASKNFFPTRCVPLLAKRFRTCFIDQIQDWCTAHHIVLTGHLMCETGTKAARNANGDILTVLSGMKLPGIDDIYGLSESDGFEYLTYSTAQYAIEKQGNNGGLAELFACQKCDIDFAKLQQYIFLAGAFGIDHYLLAVAAMDPRGNSIKKEYFNPFSWEIPQLQSFREWSKTACRAAELAKKERLYDIAVRYTEDAPDLYGLLRELASRQISWMLLQNDDAVPDDIPFVLRCDHNRLTLAVEKDHKPSCITWNVGLALTHFESFQLSSKVCYKDGALVNDVFIRRYKDGTVLVIDMAGRDRELILHRNGQEIPFRLTRFGVQEFPGWQLDFDHKHIQRIHFDAVGRAIIDITTPQKLQLALRHYAGTAEVTMDGTVIIPDLPCKGLPESYDPLYRLADLGEVSAGKHILELKNNAPDFPFLPAALLLGGEDLPSYTGRVLQKAKTLIPRNALKIKTVNHTPPGDVELFINGRSLGICLTAPYEWIVPDEVRGEYAEMQFRYSSSISAMFGDVWQGRTEPNAAMLRNLYAPSYHGKPHILEVEFQ